MQRRLLTQVALLWKKNSLAGRFVRHLLDMGEIALAAALDGAKASIAYMPWLPQLDLSYRSVA